MVCGIFIDRSLNFIPAEASALFGDAIAIKFSTPTAFLHSHSRLFSPPIILSVEAVNVNMKVLVSLSTVIALFTIDVTTVANYIYL